MFNIVRYRYGKCSFKHIQLYVQKYRLFTTKNTCKDINNLLIRGITHYDNNQSVNAVNCFDRIIKDENAEKGAKATAHLYMAKTRMRGSSRSELLSIGSLEKSRDLFKQMNEAQLNDYKEYEKEMKKEFETIIINYGSLDEYKRRLKLFLKNLKISIPDD